MVNIPTLTYNVLLPSLFVQTCDISLLVKIRSSKFDSGFSEEFELLAMVNGCIKLNYFSLVCFFSPNFKILTIYCPKMLQTSLGAGIGNIV